MSTTEGKRHNVYTHKGLDDFITFINKTRSKSRSDKNDAIKLIDFVLHKKPHGIADKGKLDDAQNDLYDYIVTGTDHAGLHASLIQL